MPDPRLQPRVQKGVPTAGRFAAAHHAESTVTLGADPYAQAYDHDLQAQGSPILYGDPVCVLPDDQKDGLDRDLDEIRRNRMIQPAQKLRLEDMARQIEEFGVVRMTGPGPVADVRFGKGSAYGGDIVPGQFRHLRDSTDPHRFTPPTSVAAPPPPPPAARVQAATAPEERGIFKRFFAR